MAAVPIPLLFAALTGRSGHGLAPYGPRCPTYSRLSAFEVGVSGVRVRG